MDDVLSSAEATRRSTTLSADLRQLALDLIALPQGIQRGDEVADAAEFAVNRSKADIGHFAEVSQLFQHQITQLLAGDFFLIALLKLQLDFFNEEFEPAGFKSGFSQARTSPVSNLLRLNVSLVPLRLTTVMVMVSTRS